MHKTMRAEFFDEHDRTWPTIDAAQEALDAWVASYNTTRPHRSLGGRTPAEAFVQAAEPITADTTTADQEQAAAGESVVPRPGGVSRWVDQSGAIHLAGATYRVGTGLVGRQVEAVARGGLVEIFDAGVLIATHVQRRRTPEGTPPRAVPARSARKPTSGLVVTRRADGAGHISFAGVSYAVGRAWARQDVQVAMVAGSVQISGADGKVIRVHPARHDPLAEMGAFAVPHGRPRRALRPAPATASRPSP